MRSSLRRLAFERSRGLCEWPRCSDPPAELAHLHSIGIGGRPSADEIGNVAALCGRHARISDGEQGGDLAGYELELRKLLGPGPWASQPGTAWAMAEAMMAEVAPPSAIVNLDLIP